MAAAAAPARGAHRKGFFRRRGRDSAAMQRAEGGNHPLSRSPSPRGRRPRAEVPSAAPAAETRREGLLEEDAAVPPTARPSPLLRHASSATLAAMEGKRVFAFGVSGWCGSILASEIKSRASRQRSHAVAGRKSPVPRSNFAGCRLFIWYLGVVKSLKAAGLHKNAYLIGKDSPCPGAPPLPSSARDAPGPEAASSRLPSRRRVLRRRHRWLRPVLRC